MSSTRTANSYLSPALTGPGPSTTRKLRKEERDRGGLVLPQGSGTGYGQSGKHGQVIQGTDVSGNDRHLVPRLQAGLQHVKERRQHARHADDLRQRGTIIDEDGVAHDSEYVQFRSATPVHMHARRNGSAYPDADDSASSSSSSSSASSEDSAFPSSPYTYQSTHRTTTSSRYAAPLNSTASAIPSYLQSKPAGRSSLDYSSTLTVPRAPSPRRERDRDHEHRPRKHRSPAPTTSSYQPPAPAFMSVRPAAHDYSGSLRLPPRAPVSADSNSLTESIATLSVKDTGGSGYNQFSSTRPPKLDGTALDAGVHGMKRSWDGFKCQSLPLATWARRVMA